VLKLRRAPLLFAAVGRPSAGRLFSSPVNPRVKNLLFLFVANLLGFLLVFGGAEFVVRWRAEHGFSPAWRSLFTASSPLSDLGTGNVLIADPDLGYRFNPALPGVNSIGIRGPEIAPAKAGGKERIVVLGDSVAAPANGFVTLLREALHGQAEVINAAVPGYTTYQERRLLERDLLRVHSDLVLLQYCLNDNHQFLHRFDAQAHMLFTEEARRAVLPSGSGLFAVLARHSYLALRIRLALLSLRAFHPAYPWEDQPDVAAAWQDDPWNTFAGHLAAMRDEVAANGGRLTVLMAPYRPQFDSALLARNARYVLKPQEKMTQICSELGVPLLDLYPVFTAHGGGRLFFDNYHFNAAGHSIAAESLLGFLRSHNLLNPGL
jgi:lysophospholipase L1-like esterase